MSAAKRHEGVLNFYNTLLHLVPEGFCPYLAEVVQSYVIAKLL